MDRISNLEDIIRYENISNKGKLGYLENIQRDMYLALTTPEPMYDAYLKIKDIPNKISNNYDVACIYLNKEINNVFNTYSTLFSHPSLFVKGGVKLFKDFYNNVRSIWKKDRANLSDADIITRNKSTAYFISLFTGLIGTTYGVKLLGDSGMDDTLAATVGAPVIGYVLSMGPLIGSYVALSRDKVSKKLNDAVDVVATLSLPALMGALTAAPVLGGIVSLGIEPEIVVGVNSTLGIITYAGIAGAAINSEVLMENRKKKK